MAKGDQERVMRDLEAARRGTARYTSGINQRLGNVAMPNPQTGIMQPGTGLRGQQETFRNDLTNQFRNYTQDSPSYAGYKDFAATGGADVSHATNTFRNIQGGSPDIQKSIEGLRNIDFSGVNSTISDLKNFAATGGMSAADKENVLRPLYYEFEKSGGYTPEALANIKKESNAVIPSFYKSMQDEMDRRQAASGYTAGFGANAQSNARQAAIASGDQATRTNIGLAESVRQGRMGAADAIQRGQLGISDITGRNTLGGYQAAGSLGLGVTGQQAENQQAAGGLAGQLQQLRLSAAHGDLDAQRMLQSGKLAGLGGMAQGEQFGLGGLAGMYQSGEDRITQEERNQLEGMGLDVRQIEAMLQNSTQPGKKQQLFNNILRGVGTAAGAMTGFRGY